MQDSPISTSRSNRPGLRKASSNALGRLVAPITTTPGRFSPCDASETPSIRVKSVATTRFSISPGACDMVYERGDNVSNAANKAIDSRTIKVPHRALGIMHRSHL